MMPIRYQIALAAFCAILHGPLTVSAATISKQSGAVLINKGDGLVSITSVAELAPGTQIVVQPGGLASIAYANNCTVRIGPGIWLVQAAPPCANGATEIDFTGRMNQQSPPAPTPDIPPLVVGGVIVAGVVGTALLVSQAKRSKPASP